ncbi:MAG: hypothetical protein AAFV86_03110 [Pseudomonadota bacterium]
MAVDWVAMGVVVLVMGITTFGMVGDDVDMVKRSLQGMSQGVEHIPDRLGDAAPK